MEVPGFNSGMICDLILENRQYFMHNSNKKHIQKQRVKRKTQASEKKFTQVFIALLVGELTLQWINPGNHCVPLSIGRSNILVSSSYTGGFLSYGRLFTLW